nr:hypothetical protein [Rhodococcus sp. (in: high G+C Gram-positive bacteria)]
MVYADGRSPEIVERLQARRQAGDGRSSARGTEAENEICDIGGLLVVEKIGRGNVIVAIACQAD